MKLFILLASVLLVGCAAGSAERATACTAWDVGHEVAHEIAERMCGDAAPPCCHEGGCDAR